MKRKIYTAPIPMTLRTKKRPRFKRRMLNRMKEPHPIYYFSHRVTFWIAALSLLAFVTGNMLGQHGWTVFWKSVLGVSDDSLIVYTGTVAPIEKVPNYQRWALYGGNPAEHLYREVPADVLVSLPSYDLSLQRSGKQELVYSIGYLGSYKTGADGDGNHPGVDIRVPIGTPVRTIANGIVTHVREDAGGFGKYIVVRHPHMPDPANPSKETVLFSIYAHLNETLVSEGEMVQKGERIALSGKSGFATGPHLHFQIDRHAALDGTTAPFHPYWPFTGAEARDAGLTLTEAVDRGFNIERSKLYTISPMTYIQAQYPPIINVVRATTGESSTSSRASRTVAEIRNDRMQLRLARRTEIERVASLTPVRPTVVVERKEVVSTSPTSASVPTRKISGFSNIDIRNSRSFTGRKWEEVIITLLDENGNKIMSPSLDTDLYLRTAFGKAEFRPPVLSALDFRNGEARVQMLPLGQTTIIIQIQPVGVFGAPMKFVKQ